MITDLNLATRPFRNRVLPYLLSAVLLFVAAVGGIVCLAWMRGNAKENEQLVAKIAEDRTEIDRLKGEGEKVQQQLTPEQKAILSASHKLVANKTFGWSRLFADLERVLPGTVSASRIAVENIYNDNGRIKAELDFSVVSRDYASVDQMIQNMAGSGVFQAELRGQDLQKNERITFTEYTLHLVYSPGYGYSNEEPTTELAQGGAQ